MCVVKYVLNEHLQVKGRTAAAVEARLAKNEKANRLCVALPFRLWPCDQRGSPEHCLPSGTVRRHCGVVRLGSEYERVSLLCGDFFRVWCGLTLPSSIEKLVMPKTEQLERTLDDAVANTNIVLPTFRHSWWRRVSAASAFELNRRCLLCCSSPVPFRDVGATSCAAVISRYLLKDTYHCCYNCYFLLLLFAHV